MSSSIYTNRYALYYDRTLQSYPTGFKLALGGTGSGKTRAILETLYAPHHKDLKCIYIADRKHLLEAMKQEAENYSPGSYALIYPDHEMVQMTMSAYPQAFETLLRNAHFQRCLELTALYPWFKTLETKDVLSTYQTFKELLPLQKLPNIERFREVQARFIFDACKVVLIIAKSEDTAFYQDILHWPVIHSLFPCIPFCHDPKIKMLLLTLHKAFYGFFDGEITRSLAHLQRSGEKYVIFLDECDFLEHDLINLACQTADVDDPFHLIEPFYREMKRHRLPRENYPEPDMSEQGESPLRRRIKKIMNLIENDIIGKGIHFPDINQFTAISPRETFTTHWDREHSVHSRSTHSHAQKCESFPIFQTRHTIYAHPLYFYQTSRSFELVAQEDPCRGQPYSALYFFSKVNAACRAMIEFLKELSLYDPIRYREILHQCFHHTTFKDAIERLILSYPSQRERAYTQRGALLEYGYDFYDVKDLQQVTDDEEVLVRHYSMVGSAEQIIAVLAANNLVFGLSATADIPRIIQQFDLEWLREQKLLIEPDEEDRRIIQECDRQKARARGTHLSLETIPALDPSDSYQRDLEQFVQAVATDPDFGQDTHEGHLKKRVCLFFSLIRWMCQHAEPYHSLLIFLNTFQQIKLVFDRYPDEDKTLFTVNKFADQTWFTAYTLHIQGKMFLVVFYNATVAKNIRQVDEAQDAFDELFWQGYPVILVTQYRSAGHGINLQYRPGPHEKRQDFTHCALLETPYYYFSPPEPYDSFTEQRTKQKENIWYLAKLYVNKFISERQFRQMLEKLDHSEWLNAWYRRQGLIRNDALFNDMAIFIQALGRVERIWDPMPQQTVLLSSEVEQRFRDFCKPSFDAFHQTRDPFISENIRQLFALIRQRYHYDQQVSLQAEDPAPADHDRSCRIKIDELLRRLEAVRQGYDDLEASHIWVHLRQAVLRHDFQDRLLQEYDCVTSSPYYHQGIVYMQPNYTAVPAQQEQPDIIRWEMDTAYYVVRSHPIIRNYFLSQGYELAFDHPTQEFFTPYCYRSILLGAIGEEAITALLQHEGIPLEAVPNLLFEVADLKIRGIPCYIDCKYYSDETMDRFSAQRDESDWHERLNDPHLREQVQRKLQRIEAYHQQPGTFILLNLCSRYERRYDYYQSDCQTVVRTFPEAAFVVIAGALQTNIMQQRTLGQEIVVEQDPFQRICSDIRQALRSRRYKDI